MNFVVTESALEFDCGEDTLVGVLARPPQPLDTAVIIVVGGPQYRAGSHRQFVLLARHLARAGHAVLRFDVRGMGDSEGTFPGFERLHDDIDAAVGAVLRAQPQARRVVLWGLCDGASAALLYCGTRGDARIAGLCLANPWVRTETGLARTHVKHYYVRRLMQREFWAKLLRGGVGASALSALTRNVAMAHRAPQDGDYTERMAAAWQTFDGPLLLLLSENDYTAKEFLEHVETAPAWRGALRRKDLRRHDVAKADHTFSSAWARSQMESHTLTWLQRSEAAVGLPTVACVVE